MATIKYTIHTFHRPPLISEQQYNSIKKNLQQTPNYIPFPIEGFFKKFMKPILIYVIGTPIAIILGESGVGLFELMAGLFLLVAIGGLFSLVPEWISYLSFLAKRGKYYRGLLSNLKKSNDYLHFRELML